MSTNRAASASAAAGILGLRDQFVGELQAPGNEPGYLLSTVLITLLVALFAAYLAVGGAPEHLAASSGTIILGLYLLAWGFMFLASYYLSHKSILLRGLIWVCEHFSAPAGRGMAFFYFALCAFGGGVVILKGLGLV